MKPKFMILASYMLLQMRFAASKQVLLNSLGSNTCSPLNAYTVSTVTNVTTFSTYGNGIVGYQVNSNPKVFPYKTDYNNGINNAKPESLNVSGDQITEIKLWYDSSRKRIQRIDLKTQNNQTSQHEAYNHPSIDVSAPTGTWTYNSTTDNTFQGFQFCAGDPNFNEIPWFAVVEKQDISGSGTIQFLVDSFTSTYDVITQYEAQTPWFRTVHTAGSECGAFEYAFTYTPSPKSAVFSLQTKQEMWPEIKYIDVRNGNKSDYGIYNITVTARFSNNIADCSATADLTGTVNITYDKCLDAVIRESDWVTVVDFTYDLSVSVMTTNSTCGLMDFRQNFTQCPSFTIWEKTLLTFTDQNNNTHTDQSILLDLITYSWDTSSGGNGCFNYQFNPTNNSQVGKYKFEILYYPVYIIHSVSNYPWTDPLSFKNVTINIEVTPCNIISIVAQPLPTIFYKQFIDSYVENLIDTSNITQQTPLCNYTMNVIIDQSSLISSGGIQIIQPNSSQFNIILNSTSKMEARLYQISIIIQTYNEFNLTNVSTTIYQQLEIQDACSYLDINSLAAVPSIDLIQFQDFTTQVVLNFTDYLTVDNQLVLPYQHCGLKQIEFIVQPAGFQESLSWNKENMTLTFAPTSILQPQQAQGELKVAFVDYKNITNQLNLSVTVLQSINPNIPAQLYYIGEQELKIDFSNFEIIPRDYSTNQISLDAFLKGSADLNQKNIKIEKLKILPSFMIFSEAERRFYVQTSDPSTVDIYTIVLVANYSQYNASAFTYFTLRIFSHNSEPIFKIEPQLKPPPTSQVVQQCKQKKTTEWSYKFGESEGMLPIKMTVSTDDKYLIFDDSQLPPKLMQVKFESQPVNVTVFISLTDSLNNQKSYKMLVEFKCSSKEENKSSSFSSKLIVAQQEKVKKQKSSPSAYIASITNDGLMTIKFNTTMRIPSNAYELQTETIIIDGATVPLLYLEVQQGVDSDIKMLRFNWTFVSFTNTSLQLQLDFVKPGYVSSQQFKDKIQVTINGFQYFQDSQGNFIQPQFQLKLTQLPQITSKSEAAQAAALAQKVSDSFQSIIIGNSFIQILIAGPMGKILGAIKSLQLQTHLQLIDVQTPAIVTIFFSALMQLTNLNLFDSKQQLEKIVTLDEIEALNTKFENMGYSTFFILCNFGTLWLTLIGLPIVTITIFLVLRILRKFPILQQRILNKLFFDYSLKLVNETFLIIFAGVALNTLYYKWNTSANAINSIFCTLGAFLIVGHLIMLSVLFFNPKFLNLIKASDTTFKARFGSMFTDKHIKRSDIGTKTLHINLLGNLRKVFFVVTVVYMSEKPIFSIIFNVYQSLCMIILVGLLKPYKDTQQNNSELFNEFFVLVTTYHQFCYTDFVLDIDARTYMGWSLVYCIILSLIVSFGMIFQNSMTGVYKSLRKPYLIWRYNRAVDRFIKKRNKIRIQRAKAKQAEIEKKNKLTTELAKIQQEMFGDSSPLPSVQNYQPPLTLVNAKLKKKVAKIKRRPTGTEQITPKSLHEKFQNHKDDILQRQQLNRTQLQSTFQMQQQALNQNNFQPFQSFDIEVKAHLSPLEMYYLKEDFEQSQKLIKFSSQVDDDLPCDENGIPIDFYKRLCYN